MEITSATEGPITDEWCAHRFDYLSTELGLNLNDTLGFMRDHYPVAWSEQHGGYWIVTRYEDIIRVAQDWETFSSAHGVSVPEVTYETPAIPVHIDPPLQRTYRKLINRYFTPVMVAKYEGPTRALVTRMLDEFITAGRCEFMSDFARPFPGNAFFEFVLDAPRDEVARLNELSIAASIPSHPDAGAAWQGLINWVNDFVDERRHKSQRGDVVDGVTAADIDGRPITAKEITGIIMLLILGGLDTTAGALGQIMIRFTGEPETAELLRRRPDLVPGAVEELLRLEGPFIAIARTAMRDTEIGGQLIKKGDKVLIYWASANRDGNEFACPQQFDLDRTSNRHLAFGVGTHRCPGSNLARLNLRIALEEITRRMGDFRLQDGAEIGYHSALNRAPLRVPITFTPLR